jgi:hypothetical protein
LLETDIALSKTILHLGGLMGHLLETASPYSSKSCLLFAAGTAGRQRNGTALCLCEGHRQTKQSTQRQLSVFDARGSMSFTNGIHSSDPWAVMDPIHRSPMDGRMKYEHAPDTYIIRTGSSVRTWKLTKRATDAVARLISGTLIKYILKNINIYDT